MDATQQLTLSFFLLTLKLFWILYCKHMSMFEAKQIYEIWDLLMCRRENVNLYCRVVNTWNGLPYGHCIHDIPCCSYIISTKLLSLETSIHLIQIIVILMDYRTQHHSRWKLQYNSPANLPFGAADWCGSANKNTKAPLTTVPTTDSYDP